MPVGRVVNRLVAHAPLRVLLRVVPFLLEHQLFYKVGVRLLELLYLLPGFGIHRLIRLHHHYFALQLSGQVALMSLVLTIRYCLESAVVHVLLLLQLDLVKIRWALSEVVVRYMVLLILKRQPFFFVPEIVVVYSFV